MGILVHPTQAKKEFQFAQEKGFPDIVNSTPKKIFIRWANYNYDRMDWVIGNISLLMIIIYILGFGIILNFSLGSLMVPLIPFFNIIFVLALLSINKTRGRFDGSIANITFVISYLVYYYILLYSIEKYLSQNSRLIDRSKFFMFGIYRYKSKFPFLLLETGKVHRSNIPFIIDWLQSNDNLKEMVAINLCSHLPNFGESVYESLKYLVDKSEFESSRKYAFEVLN